MHFLQKWFAVLTAHFNYWQRFKKKKKKSPTPRDSDSKGLVWSPAYFKTLPRWGLIVLYRLLLASRTIPLEGQVVSRKWQLNWTALIDKGATQEQMIWGKDISTYFIADMVAFSSPSFWGKIIGAWRSHLSLAGNSALFYCSPLSAVP